MHRNSQNSRRGEDVLPGRPGAGGMGKVCGEYRYWRFFKNIFCKMVRETMVLFFSTAMMMQDPVKRGAIGIFRGDSDRKRHIFYLGENYA